MVRLILCLLVMILCSPVAWTQVSLTKSNNKSNEFGLVNRKGNARLYVDGRDFEVVKKAAKLFSDDVQLVTGQGIQVGTTESKLVRNSIIVGTLGHNELIDKLVTKKKLNVSLLKERWESYLVEIVHNPFPGVNKALIVVGSDRRGTAYGLFSISELIGVSPWYWWADALSQSIMS